MVKRDRELECPVCMSAITEDDVATFPCGHVVCGGCDRRLMETGHLRCPTCRTVREGCSDAEANLAARARAIQDAGPEEADFHPSAFERPRPQRLTHVLFFPNESSDTPFGPLLELSNLVAGAELAPRPARRGRAGRDVPLEGAGPYQIDSDVFRAFVESIVRAEEADSILMRHRLLRAVQRPSA